MTVPAIHRHQPIQVYEMMERLGIEPSGGALPRLSLRYATAFQHCEACRYKNICRDWLDHAPASVSIAPHFCPDAEILFELQFDQPGLSSAPTAKLSRSR